MKGEHEFPTIRRLLGPGLMLLVVLVAGAFLEAAADDGPESWLLRAYLVIEHPRGDGLPVPRLSPGAQP